MATCSVRWRSSGGRGEFEYVPSESLTDRNINVLFEPLNVTIPAEVKGIRAQGKPRLRKFEPNNRQKFHLPQLVMAVARLPEPAREDTLYSVTFPLENKAFLIDAMDFDIIFDDGLKATLAPLRVSILHSKVVIELQDRLTAIATDIASVPEIAAKDQALAEAVRVHGERVMQGINTTSIRTAADRVITLQSRQFGMTNAGSIIELEKAEALPATEAEEVIVGKEGRLLTRIHIYKERDRRFASMSKDYYRQLNGGRLVCVACGLDPHEFYGELGERCIEAHHTIPIEELQPDSVTLVEEMAMVCASCHRIIHTRKPCLTIEEVKALVAAK